MPRTGPQSPEHVAKRAEALRRYHADHPDSHLRRQPTGPASPLWQGGTAPATYRRIAFDAHGESCQRCGSTQYLRAHHIDRDRMNNDPANLEVLCGSCHAKEHWDERGQQIGADGKFQPSRALDHPAR